MSIRSTLAEHFQQAMIDIGIDPQYGPALSPSKKAQFGDFQANGAMASAKQMKTNPRDLAAQIIERVELDDIADKLEVAGPGFINIHLNDDWLAKQLEQQAQSPKPINPTATPETVVIDYSSPNLAKEMHVGHLRSTIIGDSLARVLEALGHRVVRQNHVGDWGTQFGMLLTVLESMQAQSTESLKLSELEDLYREAKRRFDEPGSFADTARDYVVKLQAGDAKLLDLWSQFRELSLSHSQQLYDKLNVTLTPDDVRGESAYNDDLPVVVDDLLEQGIAINDDGATVVLLPELSGRDDKPSAVIVQKREGGYLYATTDLAAIRYRVNTFKPQRLLYFIDARQFLHMQQVFTVARKAGYVSDDVSLEFHPFGTMMGKDGKPFKTRDGDTIKLEHLINEAIEKAAVSVKNKNPEFSDTDIAFIAEKVGVGAIKYADLSKTRTHDYVFDWEEILNLQGNTGPYLQYAYARIQSLFRRNNMTPDALDNQTIVLTDPIERDIALKLLSFTDTLELVAKEAYPHILCTYLYELATLLNRFYEACPVLKDGVAPELKLSRLQLLKGCAQILHTGLDLLGIHTIDKM